MGTDVDSAAKELIACAQRSGLAAPDGPLGMLNEILSAGDLGSQVRDVLLLNSRVLDELFPWGFSHDLRLHAYNWEASDEFICALREVPSVYSFHAVMFGPIGREFGVVEDSLSRTMKRFDSLLKREAAYYRDQDRGVSVSGTIFVGRRDADEGETLDDHGQLEISQQ